MPSNSRADNQYYGKYRECCVVAQLNNEAVEYHEDYDFTDNERSQLFNEAQLISDFLGQHKATYLGNHTASESGDILLDNGEVIEIKSVSAGTGTYFNTSIYYFTKYGFNFKDYMEKYGLYDAIEKNFKDKGISPNRKNNSPVSQTNSSFIRHNYEQLWKNEIVPVDEAVRHIFIADIANYFSNYSEKIYEFISDMMNKNTATSKKTAPDRLIVLNYAKNKVYEVDLKHFTDNISTNIRITDKGLVIGNIRIAISWQNGIGLNNPTIRIFLEG